MTAPDVGPPDPARQIGLLLAGALALVAWWSFRTGVDVSGVLMVTLLSAPPVVALALPVSAAVLLRRPWARAWCDDLRREPRR